MDAGGEWCEECNAERVAVHRREGWRLEWRSAARACFRRAKSIHVESEDRAKQFECAVARVSSGLSCRFNKPAKQVKHKGWGVSPRRHASAGTRTRCSMPGSNSGRQMKISFKVL